MAWKGVAQIRAELDRDAAWMQRAACIGLPLEVFFPDCGEHVTVGAKRVCSNCEVQAECLDYALRHNEIHGCWGGVSPRKRRDLRRERRVS